MRTLKEYKELCQTTNMIVMIGIVDMNVDTNEIVQLGDKAIYLEPGDCRIDILCNAAHLVFVKDNMADDKMSEVQEFYQMLNQYVKLSGNCPDNHIIYCAISLLTDDAMDKEVLMMSAPLIWTVDDAANEIKICFLADDLKTVTAD